MVDVWVLVTFRFSFHFCLTQIHHIKGKRIISSSSISFKLTQAVPPSRSVFPPILALGAVAESSAPFWWRFER